MGIFFREGEEGKNGNVRELIEILISTDVNLFVHEVVVICCSLYREDAYNFDIASLIVSSCVFSTMRSSNSIFFTQTLHVFV